MPIIYRDGRNISKSTLLQYLLNLLTNSIIRVIWDSSEANYPFLVMTFPINKIGSEGQVA